MYVEQHTLHDDGSEATIELDLPDNGYLPERVDYGYDSAGRTRSMLFSDGIEHAAAVQGDDGRSVRPRARGAVRQDDVRGRASPTSGGGCSKDVKVVGASDVRYLSFDH